MKNNVMMMWTGIAAASLMLSGLLLPPIQSYSASNFNFSNFSTTTGLQMNGDAAVANDALRLTPSLNGKTGTAWFTEKQPVANGFETTFNFRITELAGVGDVCAPGRTGADGIVFVIQNAHSGTSAISGEPGGIGYSGIPNSVAVEFDTFCNRSDRSDPNDNHVSIHTRGQNPNSAHESASIGGPRPLPMDISNGQIYSVKIVYASNTMTVFINGQLVASVPLNLATMLSLDKGKAYVGFTSATGAAYENHDIRSWFFSSANSQPTAANDRYIGLEDTQLVVDAATGVLANDTDPDGDALTAIKVSDPANGAVELASDGSFTFVPNDNFDGTDSFTYKANDGTADSSAATVEIVVDPVNDPPVANAGADQTVAEGDPVTLDGAGSLDQDGSISSYSWTQTSGSTTVELDDATSSTPSFTAPAVGSAGDTLTFELTVTDNDGDTSTDSVDIQVGNVNQPPTAEATVNPTAVNEGDTVTLDGSASTDPDGDTLTYSWTQTAGTTVILSDASSSTPTFTAPDVDEDGDTLTFELTVADDGGKTATDSVDVVVNNVVVVVNQPPTAAAGEDQTVNEGDNVELSGSASTDPDGDTLTYSWTQTAGTQVTLSGEDTASPSFTAPEVDEDGDTLTFELTVDDGKGQTATDSVDIVIRDVPDEQVAEYTIEGFYPPVDMGSEEEPVVNMIKSGRSVALKFEVFDQNNIEQKTTDVIYSSTQKRIDCDRLVGSPSDAVETTNTGGTTLRYDTDGGTFLQNWKTPSGQAGSCYSTTVTTVDGSSITAYFKLN
jgi:hypothetical protein